MSRSCFQNTWSYLRRKVTQPAFAPPVLSELLASSLVLTTTPSLLTVQTALTSFFFHLFFYQYMLMIMNTFTAEGWYRYILHLNPFHFPHSSSIFNPSTHVYQFTMTAESVSLIFASPSSKNRKGTSCPSLSPCV